MKVTLELRLDLLDESRRWSSATSC